MPTKGKYALETDVAPDKTLGEIRDLIKKYDGRFRGLLEPDGFVVIAFTMRGFDIRFQMPLPTYDEGRNAGGANKGMYNPNKHQRLTNARWRALLLVIKAKLESVELGVETFEQAFLPQLIMPSGETVTDWFIPQYKAATESGKMPPLLPEGKS